MKVAADKLRRWRENPVQMAIEELKFEPDHWQREFLSILPSQDPDKLRMGLKACTGPGKTAVLAVAALNFVGCYGGKGEHPQGLAVSITEDNLNSNLWPALSRWQQRSEYFKSAFKWTATRFSAIDHPETWFLEARTWSKKADKEAQGRTLSGLHAPYVMVIIDEMGDIPVPILRSGEQIFSSTYKWAKLIGGGNPTSLEGALYHAAVTAKHLWYIITITGDPDDPKRSPRVNIVNAREQIRLYGRENPWVMSTILGMFPPASINALLGVEDVEASMRRHLHEEIYNFMQKRLGIDVARFGDDRSVLFPRQGLRGFNPVVMRVQNTVQIAARAAAGVNKWTKGKPHDVLMLIDDTGHWGHGVIDNLSTAGFSTIGLQYHGPAIDPRYFNKRTEMHFEGADWVKGGGALPNIPSLVAEACATTYTFIKGKLACEPKELVKAKLGRSPDLWDAFCNTFGLPDMPAGVNKGSTRASADFDPMDTQEKQDLDFDPLRDGI